MNQAEFIFALLVLRHTIPLDFTEASLSISGDRYGYLCSLYYSTPSTIRNILATVSPYFNLIDNKRS
jgi:hypothetical protein